MYNRYQRNILTVLTTCFFIQIVATDGIAITREKILENAKQYESCAWTVSKQNANAKWNTWGGKIGEQVKGVPYNWGGNDTIEEFTDKISGKKGKEAKIAGNTKKCRGYDGTHQFAGVDCSGFVSRVWEIKNKYGKKDRYGTGGLPKVSKKIQWSGLKPGDILNKSGSHVRLFHRFENNNAIRIYEATTTKGYNRVINRIISRDNKYCPRRYIKIEEVSLPASNSGTPSVNSVASNPPVVSKIYPEKIPPLPSGERQLIKIFGKNFTTDSKIDLEMIGVNKFPDRRPVFVNSTELRYKINVGSLEKNWRVTVVNNGTTSNACQFSVVKLTPAAQNPKISDTLATHPEPSISYPTHDNLKNSIPAAKLPNVSDISGRYPESSTRYLTHNDVKGKSAWELEIMKQEIYARHGYIFKFGKIKKHFEEQPWYKPRYENVGSMLTKKEMQNMQFITRFARSSSAVAIPAVPPASSRSDLPGIYPEASSRYLAPSDLKGKSAQELEIMEYEIYARHGYIFKFGKMRDYFQKYPWYKAMHENVSNMLTAEEINNIQMITRFKRSAPSGVYSAATSASSSPDFPGIYPEASSRYLAPSDLKGLSSQELEIMKYEIYARHGYIFKFGKMKEYFQKKPWYKARHENISSMLTAEEIKNIQMITRFEKQH